MTEREFYTSDKALCEKVSQMNNEEFTNFVKELKIMYGGGSDESERSDKEN